MPAVRGKTDERCLGAVFILVMFPSAGKCDGFCWESPGKVGEEEIASSAAELIWTLGGVKGPAQYWDAFEMLIWNLQYPSKTYLRQPVVWYRVLVECSRILVNLNNDSDKEQNFPLCECNNSIFYKFVKNSPFWWNVRFLFKNQQVPTSSQSDLEKKQTE